MKVLLFLLALVLTYITCDAGVACVTGRTREVVVGNLMLVWVSTWYAVLAWRSLWRRRSAAGAASPVGAAAPAGAAAE